MAKARPTTSVADVIKEQIDICEYARQCGLTLEPHGSKGHFNTKQHDSLVFDPVKNCFYWNSRNESGSVIDFVKVYHGYSTREAISHLRRFLNGEPQHVHYARDPQASSRAAPAEKRAFLLPEKGNEGYKRVFAYLTKTRGIDSAVVQKMVEADLLYQDSKGNACFAGRDYDGEFKYATMRGTLSDVQWRGEAAGSDKNVGFSYNLVGHDEALPLFVTESPIDALSIMTMFQLYGRDFEKYAYLSLGGSTENALLYHLSQNPAPRTIYLCQDNDDAGKISRAKCRHFLENLDYKGEVIDKPPSTKDFNQDLKEVHKPQQKNKVERGITHERTLTPG